MKIRFVMAVLLCFILVLTSIGCSSQAVEEEAIPPAPVEAVVETVPAPPERIFTESFSKALGGGARWLYLSG